MVRGRTNFCSGARQMFRESRMCLQTIHYATKGEITGMIAACNGNFINPGRAVFARERCDNLSLARFSILPKHVVIGK